MTEPVNASVAPDSSARPGWLVTLWHDRAVRAGVIAAVLCYVALQVVFCVFVHISHEGNYAGPFAFSQASGLPKREAAEGIRPTLPGEGWDAQFYYMASNDLWLTRDAKDHMGGYASYRYQRIGVPLLAHALSKAFGHRLTSPFVYAVLQLVLVAAGFGGLVFWLKAHGVAPFYALTWLLSLGTLITLQFNMPDPVCDAFFVAAFLGLYYRRMAVYVPAATLMCLGRETYTLIPFVVWVLTVVRRMQWPNGPRAWAVRVGLTAIPGIVVLAWTLYIARQLGVRPLETSRTFPWGDLIDYPLWAGVKAFWRFWTTGNFLQMEYAAIAVLTLLVVMACGTGRVTRDLFGRWFGRRPAGGSPDTPRPATGWDRLDVPILASLPFIVLLSMAGAIVWEDRSGYLKNLMPAIVLGVLMLPYGRSRLLRAVLIAHLVFGLDFVVRYVVHPFSWSSDRIAVMPNPLPWDPPAPVLTAPRITDYRSRVSAEVVSTQDDPPYRGVWRWCHREPTKVKVTVQNVSNQAWPREPTVGKYTLHVGCNILDEQGNRVATASYPLPQDVPPGERFEMLFPLDYMRVRGKFTAHFGLVQHDHTWAYTVDPAFKATLPLEFHSNLK